MASQRAPEALLELFTGTIYGVSWPFFTAGILGYLLVLGALAGSAAGAARLASRALGIPDFRWFSLPAPPLAGWRGSVVRLSAALAPWTVSFALLTAGLLLGGTRDRARDSRIEVMEGGVAEQAGLRDGDRITAVGGQRVQDWEQLRSALRASQGPVDLELERGGTTSRLQVTPRSGFIGVAPAVEVRHFGALEAVVEALPKPHRIVGSLWATAVQASDSGAELGGPVRIVRESERATKTGYGEVFNFFGFLAATFWPFVAGVALLDGISSWLFHLTHPEAASSERPGYRFERQRQALLVVYAGYGALVVYALGATLGHAWAPMFGLLGAAAFTAVGPLTWIVGRQFWRRTSVVVVSLLAFLVPCVAFLIVLQLRSELTRAVRADGFRVTWWRAVPR